MISEIGAAHRFSQADDLAGFDEMIVKIGAHDGTPEGDARIKQRRMQLWTKS